MFLNRIKKINFPIKIKFQINLELKTVNSSSNNKIRNNSNQIKLEKVFINSKNSNKNNKNNKMVKKKIKIKIKKIISPKLLPKN